MTTPSSLRSTRNSSNTPLGPNNIFLGEVESVLPYASALISVSVSQPSLLTIYTSNDARIFNSSAYNIDPLDGVFSLSFTLFNQYFYLTVLNESGTAQTFSRIDTIYREIFIAPAPSSTQSNVNIFDSTGDSINSTSGSLDVNLKVINSDYLVGDNLKVQVQNFPSSDRVSGVLLAPNTSFAAGATSSSLALFSTDCRTISIFGTSSVAMTIAVQFSADGTNFFTSQYSTNVATASDFGFTFDAGANHIRLKRTDAGSASLVTAFAQAV